jgi:hypothetical protein
MEPNTSFVGAAKRLDDLDLPIIGYRIGVGEDELHALMEVEARSSGFDSHGRPAMLFEPHVFYRNLSGSERDEAVRLGLAYKSWKRDYPSDSYPRLREAMVVNPTAALLAASWGLPQILGENFALAGYRTVEDMVKAFLTDEQEHLEAMVRFITAAGLADDLRAHRWASVARGYNGPSYAVQGYHTRLEAAYKKWTKIKDTPWAPAAAENPPTDGEALKAVQRRLRALGYTEVGGIDGAWGTFTRGAVLAFRADNNLPIYVGIDDEFMAALLKARPRDIAPERLNATVEDLREGGSKTIEATDKANGAAVVVGGTGLVGIGAQALDALSSQADGAGDLLSKIQPLQDMVIAAGPWIMAGLAIYVGWQMVKAQRARLDDHRTGKNAGPDRHAMIEVVR